jgi:hypothetical protein
MRISSYQKEDVCYYVDGVCESYVSHTRPAEYR